MRGSRVSAAIAILACAGSSAPAAAADRPAAVMDLQGTHGFKVRVSATAKGAVLSAVGSHAAATYFTPVGGVTADGVETTFPGRGAVSVRFVPSGRRVGEGCGGRFVGEIAFRGERGFTVVDASSAPGAFTTGSRAACARLRRGLPEPPASRRPLASAGRCFQGMVLTRWGAVQVQAGRGAFSVFDEFLPAGASLGRGFFPGPGTPISAVIGEGSTGNGVVRMVTAKAPPGRVALGPGSGEASVVNAPAPFAGSGFLTSHGGGRRWRSSLSVSFPGRPNVPLRRGWLGANVQSGSPCLR